MEFVIAYPSGHDRNVGRKCRNEDKDDLVLHIVEDTKSGALARVVTTKSWTVYFEDRTGLAVEMCLMLKTGFS